MRSLLLLAALLLGVTPAFAQADTLQIVPGDGALVTDWIAPGTRTYTLRLVQPMQQNVGTTTETISVEGDEVVRVSVLSIPMQGMEQRDSLRAEAATLAPRYNRSTGGAADVSLEFMDEGVAGTATPRGQSTETIMEMTDAPVFDGSWVGEIAQSLPFAEGLVATVPVFTAQGGLTEAVLTVTGQETVGERTGWTVEIDLGPQTLTQVVDVETREVLVLRLSPQPGVVIEVTPAD